MSLGISQKCLQIAPSATFAMDAKAKALSASGVKVIGFAAGEPDFDTPVAIRDAMKDALDQGQTRYSPVVGTIELRKAIAERLKCDYGLTYAMNEIIVSNGAKHSLYTIFQSILDDGDQVITPAPCWVSYPEMVQMAGGVPVFVDASEEEGFIPPTERIAAAVTERTKAFVLNTPSNPSGSVWTRDGLEALARLAIENDFYIVSDEIYDKLLYEGTSHVSIAALSDEAKKRVLLVNGVSKSYAMTGFRIGYTAGPRDVIEAMSTYQSQATSGPNTPAQHAAAMALSMPQVSVAEMCQAFESRRDQVVEGINAIEGLSCLKPDGAFYVMLNITSLLGKKYGDIVISNSAVFAETLLDIAHVAVVPGNAFMAEGYCRLSYAISSEQIAEGLRRITQFVKQLN